MLASPQLLLYAVRPRWMLPFETSVSHYVEYFAWQGGRRNPANEKSTFQRLLRIPYIVSPVMLLNSQK